MGPLLELLQVIDRRGFDRIEIGQYKQLVQARNSPLASWFPSSGLQGFVRVRTLIEDALAGNNLSIRAARAAQAAGFSNDDAWKLSAAIGEIYSNVVEHSERTDTGYVAFATKGRNFEFVVADSGIGVLNSLRKNPAYQSVADSGTAIELALSEGVSRWEEPGHGYGFQPIFVGLANISERVRFRSGDYGRELHRNPDGRIPATTTQLSNIAGLFCSVQCSSSAQLI